MPILRTLVTFFFDVTKLTNKKQVEGIIDSGSKQLKTHFPSWTGGRHGARNLLSSLWIRKQRKGNSGIQLDSPCFHSCQSETPSQGMVPPALGVGLPSSVKPLWRNLQRHAPRFVSLVFLNSVKVTMKMDHCMLEGARAVVRVCVKKEVPDR